MVGRTRPKEPGKPVKHNSTIIAAFARQTKGEKCPLCGAIIPSGIYKKHFDECKIKSDDSDCEVIQVLTGPESRVLKAGPIIIIKGEHETTMSPSADQKSAELQPFRFEDDEPDIAAPTTSCSDSFSLNLGNLAVKEERATPIVTRSRRISVKVAASTSENQNPNNSHRKLSKRVRPAKVLLEQNESFFRSPSIVPPSMNRLQDDSPKRPRNEYISRITIVSKLEEILSTSSHSSSVLLTAEVNDDVDDVLERRAPYFVTYVLQMINKVLNASTNGLYLYDETFWREDMDIFKKFVDLSSNAQVLFLRMFLRKRMWLTEDRLRQRYKEIQDITGPLLELVNEGFIELGDSHMTDLPEALKLLPIMNLKTVAKQFQMDLTKGKIDMINALIAFSTKQKGLFGKEGTIQIKMLQIAKKELGSCYRVNSKSSLVFKAIFTLYTPTETSSALVIDQPNLNLEQAVLFQMLNITNGQIRMPAPNPCPSIINIYKTKQHLFDYVNAKEAEISMLNLQSCGRFEEAIDIGKNIREDLTTGCAAGSLVASNSINELYLKRYTAHWVYVRCLSHTATLLEKQKKYTLAVNWQRFILTTESIKGFCTDQRGFVWDRLALNLDSHLKEKEEALDAIKEGMQDPSVKAKDRLLLQDRAIRISKGDFLEQIVICDPVKKEIQGHTLSKELGDNRMNRFMFKDKDGQFVECSVEEVVRRHYVEKEGFSDGVHAEGSIWHSVMGLLFYDIIFAMDQPVWLSELQCSPADLNFESFYMRRKEPTDERLKWIETSEKEDFDGRITEVWNMRSRETNSEIDWNIFTDVESCLEFVHSVPRHFLSALFHRVLTDYRNTRSGFPDLTLWSVTSKTVAVIEVKGPGDRLSTKQRLWLDFFSQHGIRAEVCHVVAQREKRIR